MWWTLGSVAPPAGIYMSAAGRVFGADFHAGRDVAAKIGEFFIYDPAICEDT
jgi:hypothetical protein